MQITTLANIKGGCGKSTTALNLSVTGHYFGHRTAAIDIDKQASLAKLGQRQSSDQSFRRAGRRARGEWLSSGDIAVAIKAARRQGVDRGRLAR